MRPVVAILATALVVGCSSVAHASSQATGTTASYPDWTTYHGNVARTGVANTMPATHTLKLAKRITLDGAVYASPLVVRGNTIVATENNTVYAFSPRNVKLWSVHLGAPSPAAERPCGDIDPLGVTGTPIYDGSVGKDGVIYLSAELGGPPRHELVALDARSGAVLWRKSLDLPGVDAKAMQERGALTILGGRVWIPFGGLAGDCGAYKGRLVGVELDGKGSPLAYTVPTAREAGIWTPPGPTVNDGHLFVAVGNGASEVGDTYDHSDSVLEIGTNAALLSSFSPSTWPTDNASDLDLGSQGPAVVSNRWVYADGKSGTAYVLSLAHLGGIGGQVSKKTICKSFGGTAVDGDVVYVPCTDGVRAVRISSSGTMEVLWHASSPGSPVIGGGRVWSLDANAGVLHSLSTVSGATLSQINVGVTSRFATPALSGDRVLIGTLTGLTIVTTS